MPKKTQGFMGRPPGPYEGHYKPPHLIKEFVPLRLPAWMKKKLKIKNINVSKYIENLILHDTKWNQPKK